MITAVALQTCLCMHMQGSHACTRHVCCMLKHVQNNLQYLCTALFFCNSTFTEQLEWAAPLGL